MSLNPILALELRARWRAGRSFLLLLGVALALSAMALFLYQRAAVSTASDSFDPRTGTYIAAIRDLNIRASAIGRQMFGALAQANILVWLLLSAASAATGIARERERGLLESLQLSRMSAASQLTARFGGNLMLLAALQLVLLPIYSVAFLMGGVAPEEIALAFYLVLWAALAGTSLGLWFSARSHRPTGALFGALGAIAVASMLAYFIVQPALAWGSGIQGEVWLMLLHPNALLFVLSDSNILITRSTPEILTAFTAFWLSASALMLWSASRQITRSLAAPSWQKNAAWVEKLQRQHAAAPTKSRASGALLTDLPLDRFIRFSDPLLAREVKSRFRLRRAGFWVGMVRFALFLLGAGVWLFEIFWLFDAPSRSAMAPYGLRALLYSGTLCVGALAATSWTRERESGAWESLKLSLLSPRQILRAKWFSPLVSFAYYSAPLWILLPIGALYISAFSFAAGALIVAIWMSLAVALGLWISWRVRNGAAAIAWTTGLLAFALFAAPWLNDLAGIDQSLARWKYGIADMNAIYATRGVYPADAVALYQSQTGRTVTVNAFYSTSIGSYNPDPQFEQWAAHQGRQAQEYAANLRAWNPSQALNLLYYESDVRTDPTGAWRRSYQPTDATLSLALTTLLPLGLTLILLVLLRRDVRREQLGI